MKKLVISYNFCEIVKKCVRRRAYLQKYVSFRRAVHELILIWLEIPAGFCQDNILTVAEIVNKTYNSHIYSYTFWTFLKFV